MAKQEQSQNNETRLHDNLIFRLGAFALLLVTGRAILTDFGKIIKQ
jgi:hypothetical protein